MKKVVISFVAVLVIGSIVVNSTFCGFALFKCLMDGKVKTYCPARDFSSDETVPVLKNAKCCSVVHFRESDAANKYYYRNIQKKVPFITSLLCKVNTALSKDTTIEPILPTVQYSHSPPRFIYRYQPLFIQDCILLI